MGPSTGAGWGGGAWAQRREGTGGREEERKHLLRTGFQKRKGILLLQVPPPIQPLPLGSESWE